MCAYRHHHASSCIVLHHRASSCIIIDHHTSSSIMFHHDPLCLFEARSTGVRVCCCVRKPYSSTQVSTGVLHVSHAGRYNVEQKYFRVHSVVAASIEVGLRIFRMQFGLPAVECACRSISGSLTTLIPPITPQSWRPRFKATLQEETSNGSPSKFSPQ